MRTYTEQWNYTLGTTSSPYSYNNGSPYFSGGRAYFPQNSFINKDTFGTYQFGSNNYIGSYALRLQVDLSAAALNTYFCSLEYGMANSPVPAVVRSSSGIRLSWGGYNRYDAFYSGYSDGTVPSGSTGAFDGRNVSGVTGTLILLKKVIPASNYAYVAAHFTTTEGTRYSSGWNYIYASSAHNQLGVSNYPLYAGGTISISSLNVADSLTDVEINGILASGEFPGTSPTITPAPGNIASTSTTITIAPPDNTGWDIFYTIDGSAPNDASTPYATPFQLPLPPGSDVTVKAVAKKTGTGTFSAVTSATYRFYVPAPTPGGPWVYGDAPVTFSAPPAAGMRYLWTADGSDPSTPGNTAATVWQAGQVIPFGSWLPDQVYGSYAIVDIKAVTQHIDSGLFSTVATAQAYMSCARVVGVPTSGIMTSDLAVAVSCTSPNSRIFWFKGTADEIETAAKIEVPNPGAFSIPWSAGASAYTFFAASADGLLRGETTTTVLDFQVGPPVFSPDKVVSLVSASITPINVTPGAAMYYTLDGSVPTQTSSPVSGPVTVNPGQTIKAIAFRGSAASAVAALKVYPEYETTAVTTGVDANGVNHHVYETTQRVTLSSDLGTSSTQVEVANNLSTTALAARTDAGTDVDIYAWDVGGSVADNLPAVNAALSAFTVRNGRCTRHWSRVSLRSSFSADIRLTFNSALRAWLTESYYPLVFKAASRKCSVRLSVRVSGTNIVCATSVDYRGHMPNPDAGTVTITVPPDGDHMLHVTAGAGSLAMTLDALNLVTANSVDLNDDWYIEVETGAEGRISTNTITSIPTLITLSASSAFVRRAPLALAGAVAQMALAPSASSTRTRIGIEFNRPLNPVLFNTGSDNDVARVGYSRSSGGLLVAGNNVWLEYMKYAVDTTKDFYVEVDLSVHFKVASSQSATAAHVTLQLAPPEASRNGYAGDGSAVWTSYNIVSTSQELYAQVRDSETLRRVNYRESRDLKLRIERSAGVLRSRVFVDGLWSDFSENTNVDIMQAHVFLKFHDSGRRNISRCIIRSIVIDGVLSRNTLTNPTITGIDVISKSKGIGSSSYTIPASLQKDSTYLLVMDRTTGAVDVASLTYEPSDTVLVLGALELDHLGVVAWTPLVSSRTIRVRMTSDDGYTGAYVAGVGTAPRVDDYRLVWLESGTEVAYPLADATWHAPDSQQHAWTGTRLIHGVDRHKIAVSVIAGRN
jgi:hypothetical protein